MARGTYIYPPRPSMRLVTDTFSYCAEHLPAWNTISISGYHIREAGSTAVQEIAFTIANGIAYVEAALAAGLDVDAFAPRLSFFWNAHNNLFEEVAKYRAARRMWAKIMTERFGAKDEKIDAAAFPHPDRRIHAHRPAAGEQHRPGHRCRPWPPLWVAPRASTPTGSTRRSAFRPNGPPKSPSAPSRSSATSRGSPTRSIPLAGSWFVESLTDEVEQDAWEYLERIDAMGGAVDAIEAQYMQQEIEQAAYAYAKDVDAERRSSSG